MNSRESIILLDIHDLSTFLKNLLCSTVIELLIYLEIWDHTILLIYQPSNSYPKYKYPTNKVGLQLNNWKNHHLFGEEKQINLVMYLQIISLQGSMVQYIESSLVLQSEVNTWVINQAVYYVLLFFSNGIM